MRAVFALAFLVPALASADDNDHGVGELQQYLKPVAPGPGLDKAPLRAPPWCAAVRERDEAWGWNVKNRLEEYGTRTYTKLWAAAATVCSGPPNNPIAQRAAQVIEQMWINVTGLSEADAVASLAARVDRDGFAAEGERLCKALPEVHDNGDDEQIRLRVLADAKRGLFGCDGSDPFWMGQRDLGMDLREMVDRGPVEQDPLLRLAWSLNRLRIDTDPTEPPEYRLPGYAIDQFDLHVGPDQAMKLLDQPPFRGSRYARLVLMESLARYRMLGARLDEDVAKQTTDPIWKTLLVAAPKRGFDAWVSAATEHKAAMMHADEVLGESSAGCEAKLRADIEPIIKKMKHGTVADVADEISDNPIAGFLLERLRRCMRESHGEPAGKHDRRHRDREETGIGNDNWIAYVVEGVRVVNGPRMAAYWAVVDAMGELKKKAPFHSGQLTELEREHDGRGAIMSFQGQEGVIASTSKVADGVRVVFVKEPQKVTDYHCVDGNKIEKIDPKSGAVTYRQVCTPTGTRTVDKAPNPIVVPAMYAKGLQTGRFLRFYHAFPAELYSDKQAKHLVGFYSFSFE